MGHLFKCCEISDISETVWYNDTWLQWKSNKKLYVAYRMAPLPISLNDFHSHCCCLKLSNSHTARIYSTVPLRYLSFLFFVVRAYSSGNSDLRTRVCVFRSPADICSLVSQICWATFKEDIQGWIRHGTALRLLTAQVRKRRTQRTLTGQYLEFSRPEHKSEVKD